MSHPSLRECPWCLAWWPAWCLECRGHQYQMLDRPPDTLGWTWLNHPRNSQLTGCLVVLQCSTYLGCFRVFLDVAILMVPFLHMQEPSRRKRSSKQDLRSSRRSSHLCCWFKSVKPVKIHENTGSGDVTYFLLAGHKHVCSSQAVAQKKAQAKDAEKAWQAQWHDTY